MSAIFLFNGGTYKYNVDDGRLRVPLTLPEIDSVVYDPEHPADTDNSIGTEINLNQYKDILCDLAVGDKIFIGLVPDAVLVRGLWNLTFKGVDGFTGDLSLVMATDVLADIEAGSDGSAAADAITAMSIDFADYIGDAPCDAVTTSNLPWMADYDDESIRNPDALTASILETPVFLKLRQACYIVLTVTALPTTDAADSACCNNCNAVTYPHFQAGVIYDRLCADKLRRKRACNCGDTGLCSEGCD